MKAKQLVSAASALKKLFDYGGLSPTQFFFLARVAGKIDECMAAYAAARRRALEAHGKSLDGGETYTFESLAEKQGFLDAESELLEQEVDVEFPADKFCLDFGAIEATDAKLPSDKRLGFSANDLLAVQEIIHVVEREAGHGE